MGDRNGYFQLIIQEEGTFLRLFPAQDNGAPIKLEEVQEYLSRQKINNYDLPGLNRAITTLTAKTDVRLLKNKILPVSEELTVNIAADGMRATVKFYPGSSEKSLMDEAEIRRTLNSKGVKYGIRADVLKEFFDDREYCREYIIAEGKPVVQGKDAVLRYLFNLTPNAKPKVNEDGSVDFHHLEVFNGVKAGDVLATLELEEQGIPGRTVGDVEILPASVKAFRFKYGKGIHVSEDGLSLITDIDGHVMLGQEDKVIVSNTYEITGDVDTSTGDIRYDGNVIVKGNVRSGFTIIASGNVEVEGVVEGARIIAQGQIILKRGIQGMGKGILQAQGVILAKFIESAAVSTNSSLVTESILHSTVSARGEIHVNGKKSMIVGGHVRSTILIETQTAGSAMGGNTVLEVGVDPTIQDRVKQLESEQRQLEQDKKKALQMIELYKAKKAKGILLADKLADFQKALKDYSDISRQLESYEKELDGYYVGMDSAQGARIKVWKELHAGVKLIVGGEFYFVSSMDQHCQFYLDESGAVKKSSC